MESKKNGSDEPRGRTRIDTEVENGLEDTGGRSVSWDEVRE